MLDDQHGDEDNRDYDDGDGPPTICTSCIHGLIPSEFLLRPFRPESIHSSRLPWLRPGISTRPDDDRLAGALRPRFETVLLDGCLCVEAVASEPGAHCAELPFDYLSFVREAPIEILTDEGDHEYKVVALV